MNDIEDKNKDIDLITFDRLFTKQELLKDIWLKNERLYNAQHTDEQLAKLKKKKRSKLFIPVLRNSTNIIKSIFVTAFFGTGNPIEIVPLNEDESDLWVDRNKVLNYYYNKLKPNKELSKAFLSALLFRMGVVTTYWCNKKKKVITTHIPITDIAFDDECVNIDDVQVIAYKFYESNRIIKQKIDSKYYDEKKIYKKLFRDDAFLSMDKRRTVKVMYMENLDGTYNVKTFIDHVLVKIANFENSPFQYGYALDKLPAIDEEIRKDEILCYGRDIVELTEELQKEINQKRNLKNDIQEEILNPSIYVGQEADVNPRDLTLGAGARIRVKDINDIKERPVPSEYALNTDLQILAGDMQSAIGVNSIQEGQTNASDRRSATALAVVNSNSSARIEEMILLMKETLFEHWAKTWVKLIMKNADDEIINKITGKEFPFGKKGKRDSVEYDLRINFGMTIDKEKRINDLVGIYQMTSQNQNINPKIITGLLKKILSMRIGEDTDLDALFIEAKEVVENQISPEDIEKEKLAKNIL